MAAKHYVILPALQKLGIFTLIFTILALHYNGAGLINMIIWVQFKVNMLCNLPGTIVQQKYFFSCDR